MIYFVYYSKFKASRFALLSKFYLVFVPIFVFINNSNFTLKFYLVQWMIVIQIQIHATSKTSRSTLIRLHICFQISKSKSD